MSNRSQRHRRYRDGIDVRGETAMARREPSMKTMAEQRAAAIVVGGRPPPANTVRPAITGTAASGQTLTTTNGTWTGQGGITYARQWYRGNSQVAGQTGLTYVLGAADVGFQMSCRVTATDSYGNSEVFTLRTAVVV